MFAKCEEILQRKIVFKIKKKKRKRKNLGLEVGGVQLRDWRRGFIQCFKEGMLRSALGRRDRRGGQARSARWALDSIASDPIPRRSRLPTSPAQHRSLFSLSFFSFFLHSSSILPEFFFCGCGLIFLAWVVVGFILVVVGWL